MKKLTAIVAAALFLLSTGQAQTNDKFWSPVKESDINVTGTRQIVPQKYLTVALNSTVLKDQLFAAPGEEAVRINESNCIITLPLPNGTMQRFRVVESPIVESVMASQYPNMKTFSIKGIDDAYANGKLDWTEFGFHGMVRSVNGDFFIDPYCVSNTSDYITYYTVDFIKEPSQQINEAGVLNSKDSQPQQPQKQKKSAGGGNAANRTQSGASCVGEELRKYRLAIACTHQYAQAATGLSAPTKAQTLAKVITSVNRVDGVYETEVAIRVILIPNDTIVLFPSAAGDPFTGNNDANTLIDESHTVITTHVGAANFDIGHTFSTGGGGLAYQGCVCNNQNKGRGITGSPNPVGDPYDIDYVAHEMGHQFGGSHTFNAITGSCSGNRNASTSVEPGSGVTIMAYAGICGNGDNLAQHSIPYFHAVSYDEIVDYTNLSTGNSCAVTVTTGNEPPVVTGSGDFIIPVSTPFSLTGTATDPDGDALTYSWEEIDPGLSGGTWNLNSPPFFRSYTPAIVPTRIFPLNVNLATANYTITKGEFLPKTAQVLNFRLTARDNKMGGGGVCYAENQVTISDDSGPFVVNYPSAAGIVWASGSQETVTWDVAGTDQGAVSCSNVKISISTDAGNTYSVLIASTDNDGSEPITVPTVTSNITICRVKVEAVDNIFFDISNNNFTIGTATGIKQVSQNNPVRLTVWPNPFDDQLSFSVSSLNGAVPTQLSVVDIVGKTVLQASYNSKVELRDTIDLSQLNPGVYFIKVSNDRKQSVYKVLKN